MDNQNKMGLPSWIASQGIVHGLEIRKRKPRVENRGLIYLLKLKPLPLTRAQRRSS